MKSAPARAMTTASAPSNAPCARHGRTNSSFHQAIELEQKRLRRLADLAERDIVGAVLAGKHRRVARAAAGRADDAIRPEAQARLAHPLRIAEMDAVRAERKGEIEVVLDQERDAAGAGMAQGLGRRDGRRRQP